MDNRHTAQATAALTVGQESVAHARAKEVPLVNFPVGQESIAHDHASAVKNVKNDEKKK